MDSTKIKLGIFFCFFSVLACPAPAFTLHLSPVIRPVIFAQETSAQTGAKRVIGAIKAINGNTIDVAPDSGVEVSVTVDATTTHIRRIAPGEKDLKNATTLQLQDLQVGDRILVAGKASDDGKSLAASAIVVMKQSDVQAKQEQDRQDWQNARLGWTGLYRRCVLRNRHTLCDGILQDRDEDRRDKNFQDDGFPALRSEFGKVRRCQTRQPSGSPSGRPTAGAG